MGKDLFEDYVPEVVEYDAAVDNDYKRASKKNKDSLQVDTAPKTTKEVDVKNPNSTEQFKDYIPEVVEYDEEIDGSDEHKIRENHLEVKEDLLGKIRKAKAAAKGNQTTFRGNIRTENEQANKPKEETE